MKKISFIIILFAMVSSADGQLPVKWEELTAPEFVRAVEKSKQVCVVPLGVMEKHGPYMPLGTDLLVVREAVVTAAEKEYVVVFPEFYAGQINEAKHQPGTIAYSPDLVMRLLEETCDEIARNGFTKIILVNGHGGNTGMLAYFNMAILNKKKNYAVYHTSVGGKYTDEQQKNKVEEEYKKTGEKVGGHAGATEAASIMMFRPDLLKLDYKTDENGDPKGRLEHLTMVSTGIWWYADFPNQYAGDSKKATKELGEALRTASINSLVKAYQEVKEDSVTLKLLDKFYKDSENPLKTQAE